MVLTGIVGALGQVAITLALLSWGYSVARRRGGVWRIVMWMPAVAAVLSGLAIAGSSALMYSAFQDVASADPADKAAQLAERLRLAMIVAASFGLPGWLLYFGSVAAFSVGALLPARPPADVGTP